MMRIHIIRTILVTTTLFLLSACNSDSSVTASGSCETNISWGSCGLPEFKNNDTSSFNLLGHYGDNVYLGDKKIVGAWRLYDMDANGSKIEPDTYTFSRYDFFDDGTGNLSSLQTSGSQITYGVAGLGYTLITLNSRELPEIFSVYSYKDDCLLVVKQPAQYFLEATTHYFCKIE